MSETPDRLLAPLIIQPDAACEAEDRDRWDEVYPCGALSRFVVERDDHNPSYSPAESCENHLAETVAGMADGDDKVRLIVTIRWDK